MSRLDQCWFRSSFNGCGEGEADCVEVRYVDDKALVHHGRSANRPVTVYYVAEFEAFGMDGVGHTDLALPV